MQKYSNNVPYHDIYINFLYRIKDCSNHIDYHRIVYLLVLLPFYSPFHHILGAYRVTIVFLRGMWYRQLVMSINPPIVSLQSTQNVLSPFDC